MQFILKTWNCFGAVQTTLSFLRGKIAPDAHRFDASEILADVHGADVLCVQELYCPAAEAFFDRLTHHHKTRDDNRKTFWPLTFGGSGLGIASRFPIVQQSLRPFERPHAGVERLARKGMMHATVRLRESSSNGSGPHELDIVTTHFQSGLDPLAVKVRERQLRQMRGFVDEMQSPERPFVICGDLNIDGLSAARVAGEYAALRATFPDFSDLGADDDRPTFHPDPEVNDLAHRFWAEPAQRIDYVLFRPSRRDCLQARECVLALHAPYALPERGRTFASDHFALRVSFEAR